MHAQPEQSVSHTHASLSEQQGRCSTLRGSDTFAAVPYAGFLSLHALDADGCSPFNRCTGITLGEGSGVVVVESYEHAKARNAKCIVKY